MQIFLISLAIGGAALLIDYFLAPIYGRRLLIVGFALCVVGVVLAWIAFAMGLRDYYVRLRAMQRERSLQERPKDYL